MKKYRGAMSRIIMASLFAFMVMLSGCTANDNQNTNAVKSTEFGQALGLIPYSFLEKFDIYYGNLGMAKEMYGVDDIDKYEDTLQLTKDQQWAFSNALDNVASALPDWLNYQESLAPLTGFSILTADRIILMNNTPPGISWLALGEFDGELIKEKLIEQGYSKTDYGDYSYYGIRGDFEMDLKNPLAKMVMAAMNRVAAVDDILITSPATEYVTGVFDAMAGDTPSIADNDVCLALADSLGNPLQATFSTRERLISSVQDPAQRRAFSFTIPEDWGTLHGYDMAALGYRPDGDNRFFGISLFYKNEEMAKEDSREIIKRMNSYTLALLRTPDKVVPFKERFKPGEPVITEKAGGFILSISCLIISEDRYGMMTILGGRGMPMRDLLFLAANPDEYIIEK